MRSRIWTFAAVPMLALVLCAGCKKEDSSPSSPGGGDSAPTVTPTPTPTPCFDATPTTTPPAIPSCLFDLVTAYNCMGCHTAGGGGAAGMDLSSAANAWAAWINVAATAGSCALDRVEPSDSANSVLIKRLSGTDCGARMPQNGPPYLTADQIHQFRMWIDAGAPAE